MDFLGKARKLESRISRSLDLAVEGFVGRSSRQPVEIVQAVLDCAEQQVQPAGRGRRVFPFNQLTVHVAASSRAERAQFEAVAEGPPTLRQRVIERLGAAGCQAGSLDVRLLYASRAKAGWIAPEYHVTFDRLQNSSTPEPAPMAEPAPAVKIDFTVASGSAERRTYTFAGGRIDIGRRAEVLDHRQRLIRRNHVVFVEGAVDENRSVSRKHAHVIYSAASREYRAHDDGSARGTAVLRNGLTIRVPQGSRGIRLESGDEIVLGDARLRVKLR
jgi:hypothetical protein